MSDGAGGPIIEPGGHRHTHGGSDVGDSKKAQVKTFVKVIMMDQSKYLEAGTRG